MQAKLELFLIDLGRALDGLARCAAGGPAASAQAAAYVRDMPDLLGGIGLHAHARVAAALSRALQINGQSAILLAAPFGALVREAITAIETEQPPPDHLDALDTLDHQIAAAAAVAALPPETGASGILPGSVQIGPFLDHDPLASVPGYLDFADDHNIPVLTDVIDVVAAPDAPSAWAAPFSEPADLGDAPSDLPAPAAAVSGGALPDAVWQALRAQGLTQIQSARVMLGAGEASGRTDSRIQARLAQTQDWLLGLGQVALDEIFRDMAPEIELGGVRADRSVAETLISALSMLPPPARITGSAQALTLFVDLHEVSAPAALLTQAGALIKALAGRIDQLEDRIRIVVPCSLARLRAVPVSRDGVEYGLNWAQFVQATALPNSTPSQSDLLGAIQVAQVRVTLRAGATDIVLYASAIRPVESMNTHRLPVQVLGPNWMRGVMVDQAGRALSWVAP